ncbi:MAG: HAD family hydrolase [Promethearchaeota archaeon]|nr:MAG: HAD family hydrolase [Candidatus Lokiarchaeota archaeon]
MMIKAIIFDFGFTLFYFKNASVKKYFKCFKEGLNKSVKFLQDKDIFKTETNIKKFLRDFNKRRLESYKNSDKSMKEITTPSLFKEILQKSGIRLLDDEEDVYKILADLYHSCEEEEWTPFDETRRTLIKLQQMNIKIGLISNHPYHASILNMLENYDLTKFFDIIMTSAKFKKRKPHKGIFTETILEMGLKVNDVDKVIMCGDEYADVVGASRAGLIPVLYLRKVDFPYEKEINIPDLITIKNINEIIPVFERFNQ